MQYSDPTRDPVHISLPGDGVLTRQSQVHLLRQRHTFTTFPVVSVFPPIL